MRNVLENLAGGLIVVLALLGLVAILALTSGQHCSNGEMWCGMRW